VGSLDEHCGSLKQLLNSNNSKMNELTSELSVQLFRQERAKQMSELLGVVASKQAETEYGQFLKKYNEELLLGQEQLSALEKYLGKFVEKVVREKPELLHLKDDLLDKLYRHKFLQARLEDRLFEVAARTLEEEVRLFQLLLENHAQKELLRENRIIRSTLNKVLVPKIVINPYLESPLVLDNYFFAASLKLSYVDSFLNRLKNRAILVELTEGGFGYLLKVNELDECVQSLCKGVITFTEKEFSDRFRTFLEGFQELAEKHRKASLQNSHLKAVLGLCREERGKELTSLLYNKLDSYLLTFHAREKTYQSVFGLLKSLEVEVAKKVSESYLAQVRQLEEENNALKEQFVSFRKMLSRSARMGMEQAKDFLYNSFKKEVEGLLNKPVLQGYREAGEKHYEGQEAEAVEVLLNRLRTQKLFYEMKTSSLEGKLRAKNEEVNRLSEQLTTLQNTLTSEQFKNACMNEEIKAMHRKHIEIEELKRQISKKEEEEVISKFKLIKINENLQGKLSRLEQKTNEHPEEGTPTRKRPDHSLGVQTAPLETQQRHKFRIRTEHPQTHK
jgi:hypothetical protein